MFLCKNCNSKIEDEMKYCPECGAKYAVRDNSIYLNSECPIELVEQNLIVIDKKPNVQLVFRNRTETVIDACIVIIKGKDQFGEETEETKKVYSDLNSFQESIFGDDELFEANDLNMRSMEIYIEKIAFEDGTIWGKGSLVKLEKTIEKYINIKEKCKEVYDLLLSIHPVLPSDEEIFDLTMEESDKIYKQYKEGMKEYKAKFEKILEPFEEFYIPEGTTIIYEDMFAFSDDNKKELLIHIPDSVSEIEMGAFSNCRVDKIPRQLEKVATSGFNRVQFDVFEFPIEGDYFSPYCFVDCQIKPEYEKIKVPENSGLSLNSFIKIKGLKKIEIPQSCSLSIYPSSLKDPFKTIDSNDYYDLEEYLVNYSNSKKTELENYSFSFDIRVKSMCGVVYGIADLWETKMHEEPVMIGYQMVNNQKVEANTKKYEKALIVPPKLDRIQIPGELNDVDFTGTSSKGLKYIYCSGTKSQKIKINLDNFPNLKIIYVQKNANVETYGNDSNIEFYCAQNSSQIGYIQTEKSFETLIDEYQKNGYIDESKKRHNESTKSEKVEKQTKFNSKYNNLIAIANKAFAEFKIDEAFENYSKAESMEKNGNPINIMRCGLCCLGFELLNDNLLDLFSKKIIESNDLAKKLTEEEKNDYVKTFIDDFIKILGFRKRRFGNSLDSNDYLHQNARAVIAQSIYDAIFIADANTKLASYLKLSVFEMKCSTEIFDEISLLEDATSIYQNVSLSKDEKQQLMNAYNYMNFIDRLSPKALKMLIDMGAGVNKYLDFTEPGKITPLYWLSAYNEGKDKSNNLERVKILIENGADIDKHNTNADGERIGIITDLTSDEITDYLVSVKPGLLEEIFESWNCNTSPKGGKRFVIKHGREPMDMAVYLTIDGNNKQVIKNEGETELYLSEGIHKLHFFYRYSGTTGVQKTVEVNIPQNTSMTLERTVFRFKVKLF